jgi:hypothetical protein
MEYSTHIKEFGLSQIIAAHLNMNLSQGTNTYFTIPNEQTFLTLLNINNLQYIQKHTSEEPF